MAINARTILARWRLIFIAAVCVLAAGIKGWTLTNNQGYMPDQPIPFSHKIHAGNLAMDCLYCHSNAEKSRHATVPPMDTCMGCHAVVRVDREPIKKLTELYNKGMVMPWIRVWSLPDHVYFNHSQHVGAGLKCQECHGPVETMEVMYQFVDFSMGWCIRCHRNDDYIKTPEKQAQFVDMSRLTPAEKQRYESLKKTFWDAQDLERISSEKSDEETAKIITEALGYNSLFHQQGSGEIDHVKAFQNASIDCSNCHQ